MYIYKRSDAAKDDTCDHTISDLLPTVVIDVAELQENKENLNKLYLNQEKYSNVK